MLTGSPPTSNAFESMTTEATDEGLVGIPSDPLPALTNVSISPVLQPKESIPPQFAYTLRNPQGKVCVRASLGVEYVVRENKVSLLESQHFYLTSQHILSRGENSLGL